MSLRRVGILAVVFFGLVGPRSLYAQCPLNVFDCGGGPNTHPMTPTAERTCGSYTMSYDLTVGELHTVSSGAVATDYAAIQTTDSYHVNGIVPGTPLTFAAELTVEGDCGSFASVAADGGTPAQRSCIPTEAVLRIPIQSNAGDSFGVTLYVMSQTTGPPAACHAYLRFTDLPDGASVVSCQGYRQDFPVPVRTLGWGGLKIHYR